MADYKVTISESPLKPGAKEPEEHWLYRLCGQPTGQTFILKDGPFALWCFSPDQSSKVGLCLSVTAERAVRSWMCVEAAVVLGVALDYALTVSLIICDPWRQRFLLTKKEGKFGTISGPCGPFTRTSVDVMLRNAYRHMRSVRVVDEITACALSNEIEVSAAHTVFLARAADIDTYQRWRKAFMTEGPDSGLADAEPVEMDRDHLVRMIREDRAAPGTHFYGGLHAPLALAVPEYL